jgi:phosphoribosyl 1,2-cyclic phosphodiesterase
MYAPTLEATRARIVLWGTRGSIPVSGPRYVRYGGNTSCMEYACGDNHLVFDAGSGIRELAFSLLSGGPRHLHLFITHTHWDHIQGFPFFTPIYIPGYEITVYGERGFGKNHEALLSGQLDRDYFPIQREDLRAKLNFRFLDDEPIFIGDIKVTREFTHHPGATVAFKIEHQNQSIAYVPDNEFLHGYMGPPQAIGRNHELVIPQEPMVNFLTGVDLMLHEAQYLAPEYAKKIGWGHSNLANACVLAKLAAVKKWIVMHHDPAHDDTFLDNKLNLTRQILKEIDCPVEVLHGHDGMVEYL